MRIFSFADPSLKRFERCLLWLLISVKLLLFVRYWGVVLGYDSQGHFAYISYLARTWSMPPLTGMYYFYHPPLTFLLASFLVAAGCTLEHGAQLVSFGSSIGAFLLLRATLKQMKFLETPMGIVFLYLTAALPLQAYLSVSVNMDGLLTCIAAGLLYVSIRAVQVPSSAPTPLFAFGMVSLVLVLGMFTKYSGLLLFPLPFMCLVLLPKGQRTTPCKRLVMSVAMAAMMFLPLYVARNALPMGALFYTSAGDFFAQEEIFSGRSRRDADLAGFFLRLPLPPSPEHRQPSLTSAWSGIWRQEDRKPQSSLADGLSEIFSFLGATLTCVGLWMMFRRPRDHVLGWVLAGVAAPFIAFLIYYAYLLPVQGYFTVKTIYVVPGVWIVGYAIAVALLAAFAPQATSKNPPHALFAGVAIFLLITHVLPVF
jgi:hypothetical protein